MADADRPVFYFDLGSPYAYLAAERINGLFTEAGASSRSGSRSCSAGCSSASAATPGRNGPEREAGIAEVERRAAAYGLPPIGWPEPWPGNTLFAMRAATFAKQTGRTVSFSLAAFRQAFAAGRDLTDPDNVLIAAAACELHPRALLKAVETDAVKRRAARGDRRAGDARRRRRPDAGRRRARSSGATTASRRRRPQPPRSHALLQRLAYER